MTPKTHVAWAVIALTTSATVACAQTSSGGFGIKGDHFVYPGQHGRISIRLGPSLEAWNVSCDKRHALVWGVAWDTLRLGDEPYSNVYLLDLGKNAITAHITISRGPYETAFSQDQTLVRIDDRILRQSTGGEVYPAPAFHAETCAPFDGKQTSAPVTPAPSYTLTPNAALGSHTADTRCWNVHLEHQRVGVYCHSSHPAFLQPLGVSVTPGPDEDARDWRHVDFATGASRYPGVPRLLKGNTVVTAEVDCDLANGAVYRPTGTCLAAVWRGTPQYYYAQLTLHDHTTGKQILTASAARSILEGLASPPHPITM